MLKHVMVRLEDSPETEFAVGAALAFAAGYRATVTGLYVRPLPPVMVFPEVPGSALVSGDFEAQEGERQARAVHAFETAAVKWQVPYRCEVRTGPAAEELAAASCTADLIVMPRGENAHATVGVDVEQLVRSVPHPFLIASQAVEGFERIAVAYDGSQGAVRALAVAADIAHHWLPAAPELTVIEVEPTGRAKARALAAAEAYLELYGIRHRTVVAHGAAAELLPEIAEREEVDLLCMGAFGHWVLRDLLLGSTTRAVLESRRKPVLLCH